MIRFFLSRFGDKSTWGENLDLEKNVFGFPELEICEVHVSLIFGNQILFLKMFKMFFFSETLLLVN